MQQNTMVWVNYILVVVVMILWGLNVVALKVLVDYMEPATMQALRILTAAIVILLVMAVQKEWRRFAKREWKQIIITSFFGVILHHLFLAIGLTGTSAVNTSLLLALVPLTTSVLAMILLGDSVTKLRLIGVFSGLAGVILIATAGADADVSRVTSGDIFVFLAMLAQAVSFIYIKKASSTLHPRELTGFMFLLGSIGLFVISFILEPGSINQVFSVPGYVWWIFLGSAVLATAVGHQIFNRSIQKVGAGETAVFNNLVPFFGLLSSAYFLKETVYPSQLAGFILIVIGVLCGTGYVEYKWLASKHKKHRNLHH
ncbi:DMT family transporter [Salibacterium salarium]|uniref:DMT family transporter n=1 Tax=Salibacterium salarium TaxID=284579 RepID=A0A428N4I4_9BACI|nr:DMT family transporter [Salibacterium salarium]RSL33394.1 DMT family transporter [Salibacterium salarium]